MRLLLSTGFLLLCCALGLLAQGTWSVGAFCGNAVPIGPSKLTDQWFNGSAFSASIEMDLNRQLTGSLDAGFTHLPNFGRSIMYRSSRIPCVGGGDRNIYTLTGGFKSYVWNYQEAQVYVGGSFGVADNAITTILFNSPFGRYPLEGFSTLNLIAGLHVGTDLMIDNRVAIRLDIGYQMMEDGYVINQYMPIQMGLVYHWGRGSSSFHL